MPADGELQPTKTEPEDAVAVRVPTSLFPNDRVQVDRHVVLLVASVLSTTVMVPVPVPATVIVRFLAAAVYVGDALGEGDATGEGEGGGEAGAPSALATLMRPKPAPLTGSV